MLFSQLQKQDDSLELLRPAKWEVPLCGICDTRQLKRDSILFIKNMKFFSRLQQRVQQLEDVSWCASIGIIFDKDFYLKIKNEVILQSFGMIATCNDVNICMCRLSEIFHKEIIGQYNLNLDGRQSGKIELAPSANIAEGVFLGEEVEIAADVQIMPGCVVMAKSKIGEGTVLFPNVTIYPFVELGKNCRIHSGTVIGADGFGYNFHQGQHLKIWHIGGVKIEDDVEIGANSNVDMGTFTPTVIKTGTKIDNNVQVGHNSHIGRGVIMCGQSASAGSVTIGDYSILAGRVGISHDLTIGNRCQIGGFSGVTTDWPDDSIIAGTPARPMREWLAGVAYLRKVSIKKKQ